MSITEKTSDRPKQTPCFPIRLWKFEVSIGLTSLPYLDWAMKKLFAYYGESLPDGAVRPAKNTQFNGFSARKPAFMA